MGAMLPCEQTMILRWWCEANGLLIFQDELQEKFRWR